MLSPSRRRSAPCASAGIARLPLESLRNVCDFLPTVPDRLQTMCVCAILHRAASTPLLACTALSFASCPRRVHVDHILAALQRWTPGDALRSLNLNSLAVGSKTLASIAAYCTRVESLVLTACCSAGDPGVAAVLGACAGTLRTLSVAHCVNLASPFARLQPGALYSLEQADFSFCIKLGVQRFLHLLPPASPLHTLDVSGIEVPIGSRAFAMLATSCMHLRALHMRKCRVVAERSQTTGLVVALDDLVAGAHRLEVLDIAGIHPTSAATSTLAASSSSLRVLNANRSCVRAITATYASLSELHVAWLSALDDQQLRRVIETAPALRILDASGTRITEATVQCAVAARITTFLASCRELPRAMRVGAPGELRDAEVQVEEADDD